MEEPAAISVSSVIDSAPWSGTQKLCALLAACVITMDGLDIQILGFAVPSIARDWHLQKSSFALLFAFSLLAIAAGSVLGGYIGDRFGRRKALYLSVLWFGLATLLMATATSLPALFLWRLISGLGIGAALPNAAAFLAEITPARVRTALFSATIVCIPLGGLLGGLIAAHVLPVATWRTLVEIGGALPVGLAIILFVALPESPRFLAAQVSSHDSLLQLLRRFGIRFDVDRRFIPEAAEATAEPTNSSVGALLGRPHRRDTLCLWLAFCCCLISIYMVFNWLPSMLTTLGLEVGAASKGLSLYNFGGIVGSVLLGLWMNRSGSRLPVIVACCGSVASALWLALHLVTSVHGSSLLNFQIGLHGFFTNSVQTALYALSAHLYPTRLRSRGIAAAAAFGRAGAVLSAFLGGRSLHGTGQAYFAILAISMTGVTLAVVLLRNHIGRSSSIAAGAQEVAA